jgi:hypothetical protein
MSKVSIVGIDIEDYYGIALENIFFEHPIEINPEEINIRVDSFCSSGIEDDDEGYILRIQYEHEDSIINRDEIDEMHTQLMDIILEGCDNYLENKKEVSQKILLCLEMMGN